VLGCTELSLFAKELSVSSKKIIDPLDVLAEKLLEKSFENRSEK
jgi:aspartate racemase